MVDDLQDLDEAEGGPQPAQGRLLVRVDLGHGRTGLPPPWIVAAGPQVQVDPAALELELVDLALAEILTTGLEGEDLEVAGEVLELGQQFSYRHPTQRSASSAICDLGLRQSQPDLVATQGDRLGYGRHASPEARPVGQTVGARTAIRAVLARGTAPYQQLGAGPGGAGELPRERASAIGRQVSADGS